MDALLGRRNSLKEHEALREMKNEFMACWDGIRAGQGGRVSRRQSVSQSVGQSVSRTHVLDHLLCATV